MRYVQAVSAVSPCKIDIKDRKILYLLSQNARYSIAQLARKIGLSRDAVAYRLRQYSLKGLVQGYKALVNAKMMGYDNYHVFLKLSNPPKADKERIIAAVKALGYVRAIIEYNGKYDYEIALCARTVPDFEIAVEKILSCSSGYVSSYDILTLTKYYRQGAFPKSFMDDKNAAQTNIIADRQQKNNLDSKDMIILRMLADDARLKLFTISEKIGLSVDAIAYRIKRMENEGYISFFLPAINYEMIGYSMHAVLMEIMPLTSKEEATLSEFFNTDKNILWASKAIGKFNTIFYILTQDSTSIHATISALCSYFPEKIRNYETLVAYEEHKYSYLPEESVRHEA